MKLPILYSLTSTGAIQQWEVIVDGGSFTTRYGQKDGKIVEAAWTDTVMTNAGRANQRDPEAQALFEAEAMWKKKKKSGGYFENIDDIGKMSFVEPMLAKNFKDRIKKITYPCVSQVKYNGCFAYDTKITTNLGDINIGDIVENNIDCEVLTYNMVSRKTEFKPIKMGFKDCFDEKEQNPDWFEIELMNGKKIQVTGNHRLYLPRLKCWRRVDQIKDSDVLALKK